MFLGLQTYASNDPVEISRTISDNIEIKEITPVSTILIAVCLSLTSDPGEEKGLDFLQLTGQRQVLIRGKQRWKE